MERIKENTGNKGSVKDRVNKWLIIGLGNPDAKWANTKHNIGFMVLDQISDAARLRYKVVSNRKECYYKYYPADLVKPQTGMNNSGEIFKYINIDEYKGIILIYDDLDLPLGQIRIKPNGSSGGHNGMKSIIQYIGKDFIRIRLGIGRPVNQKVIDYVLEKFKGKEEQAAKEMIHTAIESVARITKDGIQSAMQFANRRE